MAVGKRPRYRGAARDNYGNLDECTDLHKHGDYADPGNWDQGRSVVFHLIEF